jgi:ribosomal protein S18 acetylase RimI-like enzyme
MAADELEISTREANNQDAETISAFLWALWNEAGTDAPGLTGATEEIVAEIADPEAIRSRLGGPERRIYVATQGDRVVGFAATRAIDETAIDLAGIMVLPSLIGRRIGTPLVEAAAQEARAQGFATMTVNTEIDNEGAIGFYEARGFTRKSDSVVDVEGTSVTVASLELPL